MEKLKEVKELKHKLIEATKGVIDTYGIQSPEVDTNEIGEVIDMIKDLAETEEKCMKACYYSTVIEAMNGAEDRPGYDNWRYSSGRFAPKGSGHYAGYTPMPHIPVYMSDQMMDDVPFTRMGYPSSQTGNMHTYGYSTGSQRGTSSNDSNRGGSSGSSNRANTSRSGYSPYGTAFENFDQARRHYHETRDENAREEMKHHANEHVEEMKETMKEIWQDADPEQKKQIKTTFSQLLAEMAM